MDDIKNYLRVQQASLQWTPVLRALAGELTSYSDAEQLRQLFFQVGQRFAGDWVDRFDGVKTLSEFESVLNDLWSQINWGWVQLSEQQRGIEIRHQCAPLAEALGDESLPWAVGLLEGFYQCLFKILGADEDMFECCVDGIDDPLDIRLRLSPRQSLTRR